VEAGAWRDQLRKELGSPTPKQTEKDLSTPPPAELKGVIEKIDADRSLFSISIGSDAGLAKNHTLEVYRLKPAPMWLGMIRIIDVSPQKAIARYVDGIPRGPTLEVGDNVTSSLTAPAEKKKE
jgi:hypothetical protein